MTISEGVGEGPIDTCGSGMTHKKIDDVVVMKVSKNLLVLLAQYFPQDGTVVEGEPLLHLLRTELQWVLSNAKNHDAAVPVNWYHGDPARMNFTLASPWLYLFLKMHQIIAQLIDVKAKNPTLYRTNGYETISLITSIYKNQGSHACGNNESSDCSTASSLSGEQQQRSPLPGKHTPTADSTVANSLLDAKIMTTDFYVVFKKNHWTDDPPASDPSYSCVLTVDDVPACYLTVDEGHVSLAVSCLGRFDAYLLASVSEAVLPLIKSVGGEQSSWLRLPDFLLNDERMVLSRANHARRVYRDATTTYVIDANKFDWYVSLLTSGSIRAIQDTFVDISHEIWHSQFNRGMHSESAERLETLMVSLLGHDNDMVRSQSSVCLNNLIDRHDWQQEVPFLPIIRRLDDSYVITVNVTDDRPAVADPHVNRKGGSVGASPPCAPPNDVFIISMAPSPNIPEYVYTYHSLEWILEPDARALHQGDGKFFDASPMSGRSRVWVGTCNLGKFTKCGFYDWRLVRADRQSGSWTCIHATLDSIQRQFSSSRANSFSSSTTIGCDQEFKRRNLWPELGRLKEAREATGHSQFKTLPIQGRIVVLPEFTNYLNLHEINVDLCGAVFPSTPSGTSQVNAAAQGAGSLLERGSFAKVTARLDTIKDKGIDALCLVGCQARNNGRVSYGRSGEIEFDDEDASPYAITCRGSVCEVLGGRSRFDDLVRESWRRGLKVIVEFQSRIAVCGSHRKYRDLTLTCVDSQGHQKPLEGGQGKYFKIDESSELNYRSKKSWDLYIADVLDWLNRCDGLRLECSHLLPRIYEADQHELNRLDPDGISHYSSIEKLMAPIVIPTNKDSGFWNSTAATSHWPNPFLIKVCRAVWIKHTKAILVADCGLLSENEEGFQNKIGILARSGLIPFVQSMPNVLMTIFGIHTVDESYQSVNAVPAPAPVDCVSTWYEKNHEALPEGAVMIQSSTTPQSPYPSLLYNRGAWPAADLLQLSTDIPCTTLGEDEGQCLRRGVANVSVTDNIPPMSRVSSCTSQSLANTFLSRARSLARLENPKDVDQLERECLKQFSPSSGQDIRQISAHYKHRREFRRRYKILSDAPMMPVIARDSEGKVLDKVFTTCRVDASSSIALLGINFSERRCPHVEVSVSFLSKVILKRHPSSKSLVECWNLFSVDGANYDANSSIWKTINAQRVNYVRDDMISLMTLSELLSYPHVFSVDGFQSSGLGMKLLDVPEKDPDLQLALYLSALRRLAALASKARAIKASGKTIDSMIKLKTAIYSNYILQCLSTTVRSTTSLNDFAKVLLHIQRAWKWHLEVCAENLPRVSDMLTDVDFLSSEKPTTTSFFAKIQKIVSSLKKAPALIEGGGMSPKTVSVLDTKVKGLNELCSDFQLLESVTPIVFITSELGKWSTVGGLGVMIDELSQTIANDIGYECIVMCPYYHVNRRGETDYMKQDGIVWKQNVEVAIGPNEKCVFGVHTGEYKNVQMIFLHNESIWHHPYPDNSPVDAVRMLVAFGKAFLETLCQLKILPQILVTNDWATGLVPAYAKNGFFAQTFSGTTFFHIVHNFDPAYEGRIYPPPGQNYAWLHGLPCDSLIDPLWGTPIINPSRCVLLHCDQWGTVSPSYRDELRGSGEHPAAGSSPLKYLLNRFPRPFAVCNGVPVKSRREKIAALNAKTHDEAKAELQKKYFGFALPDLSIPLFSFIGRVTVQKGVHMILESAERIIQRYNNRVQILVGGPVTWKDPYSARCGDMMLSLRAKYPWSFYSSPNEFFSDGTLVNLGSDFGLMPSMFEPGGIVQHEFFIAGTPVIAYNTGGLKDTVHESDPNDLSGDTSENKPIPQASVRGGNGFVFCTYNTGDYIYAFERAMRIFSDKAKYLRLRKNAEASVYTCEASAREWCREFCRLRNKILINPKTIKQLSATLPPYDVLDDSADDAAPSMPEAVKKSAAAREVAADGPAAVVCQFRLYHSNSLARHVAVSGSYDQWMSKRTLHWVNGLGCYSLDLALPPGEYLFKFLVDGTWLCSDYHPKKLNDNKIENNWILVR